MKSVKQRRGRLEGEWRKGQGEGQEYRREKRKYKELYDRKKQ